MEIIKTKTVFTERLDLEKEKNIKKLENILSQHSNGWWYVINTDQEDIVECILMPLSEDIEKAGYDWKEYKTFETAFYTGKVVAVMPVGFYYAG